MAQARQEQVNFDPQRVKIVFEDMPKGIVREYHPQNNNNLPFGRINPGQVLDTIGFEIEGSGATQMDVQKLLNILPGQAFNYFGVHRDGSIEMKCYNVPVENRRGRNLLFNYHTKAAQELFNMYKNSTYGYELVSVPVNRDSAELLLYALLPKLEAMGEFPSERCSTHIHVGMANNLTMIKNLLRLGLWADELFYAISGMGDKFRGYSNNAIYARPLINGPFFRNNNNYWQTLNYESALDASNMYEFFAAYGLNIDGGNPKYHPARYFALNLYSTILHKTMEFRHFNQSFNPALVSAVAKLCQLFTEIAIKARPVLLKNLDIGDVFETKSPSYYMELLNKMLRLGEHVQCEYGLDSKDVNELENVIQNYTGIGVENLQVTTHIKDVETNMQVIMDGKLKRATKQLVPPGNTDIHNIGFYSLFGDK